MAQWGVNHGEMGHTLSVNHDSITGRWGKRYESIMTQSRGDGPYVIAQWGVNRSEMD